MVVRIMEVANGDSGKQQEPAIWRLIATACALMMMVGCGRSVDVGTEMEAITIAAYAGDTAALVWIAEDRGFFSENGLDVTLLPFEAGKLAADALLAGEADIATTAEFVFVSQSFDHDDLRIFGAIATARVNEVIARIDHGIQSPPDLGGKRIGVTRKSAGEFFLGRFLLLHGLSLADVEIVDLSPSEIVETIVRGEIDAGLTWDPNVYEIRRRLGENATGWPGQSDQDLYFILVGKEDWLRTHPEAAERFVRAVVQAEEFLQADDAAARQVIQDRFEYESEYMEYIWSRQEFRVTLPQALLIAMEDEARWRIENGLTEKTSIPNYLDRLWTAPLEGVRPETITIIR